METIAPNELFFTQFEPKRQNQFYFRLGNTGIPQYFIKQADRPNYSFEVIELPHINVTRKVKGKVSFDSVSLTLYDPINPSGSQAVMDWVNLHHESTTGRESYSTVIKEDVTYNTLSPIGEKVEEWVLKGAFIESFELTGGDWSAGDPHEITLSLAYDYPVQNF
jgi:hypothetical protein